MKRLIPLVLIGMAVVGVTSAQSVYHWAFYVKDQRQLNYGGYVLSENAGAHPILLEPYEPEEDAWKVWGTFATTVRGDNSSRTKAGEYSDLFTGENLVTIHNGGDDDSDNICVDANSGRKFAAWAEGDPDGGYGDVCVAYQTLTSNSGPWTKSVVTASNHYTYQQQVAIACQTNGESEYVYVAYVDSFVENSVPKLRLVVARSTDNGASFSNVEVEKVTAQDRYLLSPSLAINTSNNAVAYLAYIDEYDNVMVLTSDDNGASWDAQSTEVGESEAGDVCICAYESYVLACWVDLDDLSYRWSDDAGASWAEDEEVIPLWADFTYAAPNVCMQKVYPARFCVVLTFEAYGEYGDGSTAPAFARGILVEQSGEDPYWAWSQRFFLASGVRGDERDERFDPGVATASDLTRGASLMAVWSDTSNTSDDRTIKRAVAIWEEDNSVEILPRLALDGAGGRFRVESDGEVHHTRASQGHVLAGPKSGSTLMPIMVDAGLAPTLAVDEDGSRWVAFFRKDTLWCYVAEDTIVAVYCGSSSARPRQPSIAMYPLKSGDDCVANIAFSLYDSANGTSKIMYAKVKSSNVILDTIESHTTPSDSYPSISVYESDSLYVVWQHGDSVLSAELLDNDEATWSQPTSAWSGPYLVTADGRHPRSLLEGDYLHSVWQRRYYDGVADTLEAVKTASYQVTVSPLFGGWQAGSDASEADTREKDYPVYAGKGVTVWQEKVSGVWDLIAEVRGDTVTLVSSDSNSYCPYSFADSSAVTPSIDQVRVHLLWTEGIIWEVDSAVNDTGQVKYQVDSFNVSNAGSDGLQANNGCKLIRESGGDSLFAVYEDADGATMYAVSADGTQWTRSQVSADGLYPAICEDGTGKRWIVYYDDGEQKVQAVYVDGSSFSAEVDVYSVDANDCGPISVVGSSDESTSCVYAMFRLIKDPEADQLILAKFNSSSQWSNAEFDAAQYSSDPCIATEWVAEGQDADHLHLAYENTDDNEVYVTMTQNPIDPAEFTTPNVTWESWSNMSNTAGDDSRNPVVACDGDRVVVAWAERTTGDILVARRSCDSTYDNFQDTVDVSGTPSVSSEYPSIAMGDTVVVLWQEQTSGSDYDVYASAEFGTAFAFANNSGKSTYPHSLLYNKASGDSAIPYIHAVWSEEPESNYYEIAYKVWNLKIEGGGGGGGQSGGVQQLLTPMLSACRPNPFTGRTSISYQFPLDGQVHLQVFDISGRSVKTLQRGHQRAGKYAVTWDGRDDNGRNVANGVYFYRFDAPGFRDVKKAVVMK